LLKEEAHRQGDDRFHCSELFLLDFVATWNEFAMAIAILQDGDMWTLPLGMMNFQSQIQSD
jgi:raffinose/stachyose/melibiose transport system permease protein